VIDTTFATKKMSKLAIVIDTGKQLDNNNAHEMVEAITSAQNDGYKYIILDMHQLEFISSAGVGSILGTVEVCREIGGDIVLCNVSNTIMHILEVLDLAVYLTIKSDEEEVAELCKNDE